MMDILNKKKYTILIIIFLLVLSSYVFFHNLGGLRLWDWDESRNAENALEIIKSKDWIVMKYGGVPDMWNLKPPLGAWLTSVSFLIFGVSEFAVRFFSALAGIGTVLLLFFFGKEFKNTLTGVTASLLLLTVGGFVGYHGARTGDYDVLLTFFIVLFFYLYYLYEKKHESVFLVYAGACIAFAFLIKDIVGLVPLAVVFIFMLYKGSVKMIFKKDWLYFSLTFILISYPWYILRFFREGSFFTQMISYDIIGRSSVQIEGHVHNIWYYFIRVIPENFNSIFLIIIISSALYFIYTTVKKNKEYGLFLIWALLFLLAFTVAQTKISWYIIPVYPAICIMIAVSLNDLMDHFKVNEIIFVLLFVSVIFNPAMNIISKINNVGLLQVWPDLNQYQNNIIADPTQDTHVADVFKQYINKCDNLYLDLGGQSQQATFFYLSREIKGYVHFFKNINEIESKKGDFVITLYNKMSDKLVNDGNHIKFIDRYNNFYLYRFY